MKRIYITRKKTIPAVCIAIPVSIYNQGVKAKNVCATQSSKKIKGGNKL